MGNKLYNDTFPWWKDANKDFMIIYYYTWKFLSFLFSSTYLRRGLILINGFRFSEKYLIGKRVTEQKPREMTSQNCNLIGCSTHVASNLLWGALIKNHRKVMFIIFTKIFHTLIITIHKHIDHVWLKFLTSSLGYGSFWQKSSAKLRRWLVLCLHMQNRCWRHAHCHTLSGKSLNFAKCMCNIFMEKHIHIQYLLNIYFVICYIVLSLKT